MQDDDNVGNHGIPAGVAVVEAAAGLSVLAAA